MTNLDLPPLIPRDDLFGNPQKASATISPDGMRLAYLAPDEGVLNVWLRTIGQADDRTITRDRKRGIRLYLWAFDERHLLYLQDVDGDENWHVWSVDLQTGIIRDLTPFQGVQAHVIALDPGFPNEMLVGLNARDARYHDVYRVDLTTGATTLEVENPGDVVGWFADPELRVRAAHAATADGGFQLRVRDEPQVPGRGSRGEGDTRDPQLRTPDPRDWRPLITWGPDDEGHPYGFSEDGQSIYVGSSLGADTVELRLVELATGGETTLASRPDVDMGDAITHPVQHRIQAAGFIVDRLTWQVLDPAIQADIDFLTAQNPGELHVASRNLADDQWIVLFTQDRMPAGYYMYDRTSRRLDFLFSTRPALEKVTLAEMRPIEVTARDGLTLHGYLTLPSGVDSRGLPMVLNVHGGPWGRDVWGYDPEAQWLANRGYACLQMNFRGSAGYGKRFLHAGDREWGGKMHDDLIDAVDWAVAQGYADPRRVAIYGGSYGGYAALAGAAFTPDVFACAVDIVGPSNILTLMASIPPYWEPIKRLFTIRVGDPEKDEEFLKQRSPLFSADRIQCPMLIAQGKNDPRVKEAESEQIVSALRERGKAVEYMVFDDEGHGFARPENRLRFYEAAERFLARYLGGRAEE